jgi:hypothetical protein
MAIFSQGPLSIPDCSSYGPTVGRPIFQSGCVCSPAGRLCTSGLVFRPSTPFAPFLDAGNASANVSTEGQDSEPVPAMAQPMSRWIVSIGLFQQGPAVVSVRMVPAVRVEITVLTNTLCCLCRTADTARCSRPRASELCLRSRPALIATARLMKICLGSASVSRSGFIPHGRRLARSFSKRVHMMRRDSCSEVTESNVNSMPPVRR